MNGTRVTSIVAAAENLRAREQRAFARLLVFAFSAVVGFVLVLVMVS